MTYPQIGNYGIDPADAQLSVAPDAATRPALRGMVVRDMCATPSSWRDRVSLPEYLKSRGIVAIEGIDTRALVRHLRDHGAQKGIVSTEVQAVDALRARMDEGRRTHGHEKRSRPPTSGLPDRGDLCSFERAIPLAVTCTCSLPGLTGPD